VKLQDLSEAEIKTAPSAGEDITDRVASTRRVRGDSSIEANDSVTGGPDSGAELGFLLGPEDGVECPGLLEDRSSDQGGSLKPGDVARLGLGCVYLLEIVAPHESPGDATHSRVLERAKRLAEPSGSEPHIAVQEKHGITAGELRSKPSAKGRRQQL
jgi:hypothetical protein